MTETENFQSYGTQVIREQLRKMLSHADGVRSGDDVEALHDMRVASRRLRAAISVFAAAFPDPAFARFEREVKEITDALGEARDLDVMIETLDKLAHSIPEEERAGVEAFVAEKRKRRARLQKNVRRALARVDKQHPEVLFEEIVSRVTPAFWTVAPVQTEPSDSGLQHAALDASEKEA